MKTIGCCLFLRNRRISHGRSDSKGHTAQAADALLNRGVSIPIKEIKIPFRKRPIKLRVTLKRPYMSGQIEFARTYLSMGVTAEQMAAFDKEDQMRFIAHHGSKISRMIAYAICVGSLKRIFLRPVSWFIRNCVEIRYQVAAAHRFCEPDGNRPFYQYYQIGGADESDEAETEPTAKGELRSHYENSHSPFGFLWQIADATGWSIDYILYKVNYQTLIMMLSDAPRYRSGSGRRTHADKEWHHYPRGRSTCNREFLCK